MEHFHERPFAFRCLAGNQHEVARINGPVVDSMKRGGAERAHHLRCNAQDRAHRHRPIRVHPLFRRGSLEIFGHVDELIVLDSEIVQDRDVDVTELLRRNRLGFETFARRCFQRTAGNDLHQHFFPGIDLFRLVGQRAVGDFSDGGHFLRGHAVFAQKVLLSMCRGEARIRPHY